MTAYLLAWRLWARPAQVALVLAALATAGCGGGGGGNNSPQEAPLVPASVNTVLDAYPVTAKTSVNLVAGGYVPMAQGDNWVYDNTVSGDTTVGGLTRSVISGPDDAGQVVLQEIEGDDNTNERYMVGSGGITLLDPSDASGVLPGLSRDWASWLLWPNAPMAPGESRTVDRAGDAGVDIDGDGKNETYRLHAVQTFKGLKTLNVLGQPTQVAHVANLYVIEIKASSDHTAYTVTATEALALAPGLGLVQAERITMNDSGQTLDRQQLVLRAAHVGGVDHGLSTGQLDQTGLVRIVPTVGGVNPDSPVYRASVTLTLDTPGATVRASTTTNGVASVSTTQVDSTHVRADLLLKIGPGGTYNDTLTLTVCEDRACRLQAQGSPFTVAITTILGQTQPPQANVTPLSVTKQQVLTHDVVAVRYSRALDRVVMVSSTPQAMLYVLNPADGTELRLALSRAPTSLALSPDGLQAAVGHDGRVTWLRLDTVGQTEPTQSLLDLSTKAFDLALDNAGHVFVTPDADQWVSLRSIDIATNTEHVISGFLYSQSQIAARPDGSALYTMTSHISPMSLTNWLVQGNLATYGDTSSVKLGDHTLCDGLWWANDGQHLLNGCGVMVNSAPGNGTRDMSYSVTLPLTDASQGSAGYRFRHADQNPQSGEWATLEYGWYDCGMLSYNSQATCYHHLKLVADDSYAVTGLWSLPPVALAGSAYDQEGIAVFHSADGAHLFLLTHLLRNNLPTSSYLFQVVR